MMKKFLFLMIVPFLLFTTCTEPAVETFGNIAGTVTDSHTRSPLAGVTVKITPTGSSQVTGSNGTFQFDNLDVQEYTISFSKNGYYSHEEKVSVKPGQSSAIQISLTSQSSIEGYVKDSNTQSFLSGVTVKLTPGGNSVITGVDGAFHFDKLDTRDYTVSFSKAGYNLYEERVTVRSGSTATIQVNLVPKSSIVGTVKDSKTLHPLAGVSVKLNSTGESKITGDDGTFKFDNLDAQEYSLSLTRNGYAPKNENVTVRSGETTTIQVLMEEIDVSIPTLLIRNASNLTKTSVKVNATLSSTGGAQVTQHGFCYATHQNPTTADETSSLGIASTVGDFSADISGLTAGTKYYFRAYAQNYAGVGYSSEIEITTLSDEDEGGADGGGTNIIVVRSGLKVYYTFDDGDCSDATDNEVDGMGVGNPSFITDTPNGKGKAVHINGIKEQLINIPYNIFKGMDRFSISIWIKDFSTGSIISGIRTSSYSHDQKPKLYMNNSKVCFDANGTNYGVDSYSFSSYDYSSIQSGEWHHLVVMYDHEDYNTSSGIASLYVDGVLVDNMNTYWNDPDRISKVHIGGNGNGTFPSYSTFKIDNVRIYDRCLSKKEVKEIYESEK